MSKTQKPEMDTKNVLLEEEEEDFLQELERDLDTPAETDYAQTWSTSYVMFVLFLVMLIVTWFLLM